MSLHSIWYYTNLPEDIVKIIETDLTNNFDDGFESSRLIGNKVNETLRKSKNTWVPSDHWVSGFVWHYVQKANRENFLYDLTSLDHECMQFTRYDVGEYYGWHSDQGLSTYYKPVSSGNRGTGEQIFQDFTNQNCERVRKLSFSLLLSDPDTYEGGNLQLLDETGKSYIAPRQRGTIILFDSRTQHRVQKVKRGVRKSLVGWVVGPRFR